jgi:hypothetical protein
MSYWLSAEICKGLEYPSSVGARIYGNWDKCLSDSKAMEWVSAYQKVFDRLRRAESELVTFANENQRLKHENEFMLRLINKGDVI